MKNFFLIIFLFGISYNEFEYTYTIVNQSGMKLSYTKTLILGLLCLECFGQTTETNIYYPQ